MKLQFSLLRAAIALSVASGSIAADLIVVDNSFGFGADHFTIQTAVNAASNGDILLIRGSAEIYDGFDASGKGLILVGDPTTDIFGATLEPSILGEVSITGIPAGQRFVLRGLDVTAETLPFLNPVLLSATASPGTLVFEDCAFGGIDTSTPALLDLTDCGLVSFSNCLIEGVDGNLGLQPGYGIRAVRTDLHVWNSDISGGDGSEGFAAGLSVIPAQAGLDAIRLSGGDLFTSGSSLQGGSGGTGAIDVFGLCSPSQPGGHGAHLLADGGTLPSWLRVDTQAVGGTGGGFVAAPCPAAPAGQGSFLTAGVETQLGGDTRGFLAPTPPRENTSADLTFEGQNGDFVFLLFSANTNPITLPLWNGILIPSSPNVFPIGTIPPSGTLTFGVGIGSIPIEAVAFDLQPLFVDAGLTTPVLGPPVTLVIVDSSL